MLAACSNYPISSDYNGVDRSMIVAAHNRWRSQVGVPDLSWSAALANSAQAWANHLKSTNCALEHSAGSNYGENLYTASAALWSNKKREIQKITAEDVVDRWASEIENYNHADNSCEGVCGHYTQVVWKDTQQVGCGMAICASKDQVWVCHYYPPGNYVGQRPY
jgi:uncharacterized protein YkwD